VTKQPGIPEGWTLRELYPFYDGPFPEFVLEHESGARHSYIIDRSLLAGDGKGFVYLREWMERITSAEEPPSPT
jgi:hypothetical protein